MKDNKLISPSCDCEIDLPGYLYNEIDSREKAVVERHLAVCTACLNDLAFIAEARDAVADWNLAEFAGLETPDFSFDATSQKPISKSWSFSALLGGLRFPAPAFAAVAIAGVLGMLLFITTIPKVDRVSNEVPPSEVPRERVPLVAQTAPSVGLEKSVGDPQEAKQVNKPFEKDFAGSVGDSTRRAPAGPKRATPPRAHGIERVPADRTVAKKTPAVPSLNGFEEKNDETLRLEDIFSEIDAS